jgi:lysophospholipid acyltransferase (LPLAT)-like uncharacterized protein
VNAGGGSAADRSGRPQPPRPESALSRRPRYAWIGRAGALVVRIWGGSLRLDWDLPESVQALERAGEQVIYAFWHCHILPLAWAYRGRRAVVLVSRHGDGEAITQVIHRLGYGTVRGSTTRGGVRGALEMARLGRAGYPLAVTPDGPRGPRRRLQPGIVLIAQRSGRPIVPLASGMRRGRRLDSWDQFEIPAPFSRVRIVAGEPIAVPADLPHAEAGEWERRVQEAMDAVEHRAETWAGAGRSVGAGR